MSVKSLSNVLNFTRSHSSSEEMIKEYSLTKFEKVIMIMIKIKKLLQKFKVSEVIINELDWVVDNIRNKSLFDIDFQQDFLNSSNKEFEEYIKLIEVYTNTKTKPNANRRKSFTNMNYNFLKQPKKLKRAKVFNTTKIEKSKLSLELKDEIELFKEKLLKENKQNYNVDKLSTSLKQEENKEDVNEGIKRKNTVNKDYKNAKSIDNKLSTSRNLLSAINFMKNDFSGDYDTNPSNSVKEELQIIQELNELKEFKSPTKLENESEDKDTFNILDKMSVNKLLPRIRKDSKKAFVYPSKKKIVKIGSSIFTSSQLNEFHFDFHKNIKFDYDSIDFNIFDFCKEVGREKMGQLVFTHIIETINIENVLKIDTGILSSFISEILKGYDISLPYHNDIHAVDVCQTLFSWFSGFQLIRNFDLSTYDLLALYTASLVHDYKHPGLNNNYILNTQSELSIIYNDKSVLENWHVAQAFKTLLKPQNNIFAELSLDEFKDMRKRIIEAVIATDMSTHFKSISILKGKMDYLEITDGQNLNKLIKKDTFFNDQQEIINFVLHSADISHNTKEWKISEIWTQNVYEEFFNQGDIEKGNDLPVSNFCDRETTVIPKDQIGFISAIISPNFDLLLRIFPHLKKLKENIVKNKEIWEKKYTSSTNVVSK